MPRRHLAFGALATAAWLGPSWLGPSWLLPPLSRPVLVHRIDGELCGQTKLPALHVAAARAFSVQPGSCADAGYDVPEGTGTIRAPGVGTLEVELFRRPRPLD